MYETLRDAEICTFRGGARIEITCSYNNEASLVIITGTKKKREG